MVESLDHAASEAGVLAWDRDSRMADRRPDLSNRLRTARMSQDLSLRGLAGRIGVSASLISQIETGKVQPSVNTLYALACELGLSVDSLLFDHNGPPDPARSAAAARSLPSVQTSDHRKIIEVGSGVRWERLTEAAEPGVDFLYLVYEPGGESTPPDAPHRHSGREWGYVMSGTLHVAVGPHEHVLGPGDAIAYESTDPHRLHNPGSHEARGIWFVLGRRDQSPATA